MLGYGGGGVGGGGIEWVHDRSRGSTLKSGQVKAIIPRLPHAQTFLWITQSCNRFQTIGQSLPSIRTV